MIALMQKALEMAPDLADLHHIKGLAEMSFTKSYPLLAQGVSTLKKAQELGADCTWDLALALRHLGDLTGEAIEYAQAIELFESIEKRCSDNSRFPPRFFRNAHGSLQEGRIRELNAQRSRTDQSCQKARA